jgi:hypothetical protein
VGPYGRPAAFLRAVLSAIPGWWAANSASPSAMTAQWARSGGLQTASGRWWTGCLPVQLSHARSPGIEVMDIELTWHLNSSSKNIFLLSKKIIYSKSEFVTPCLFLTLAPCRTSAHGSTMHHVWSPTCLGFSLAPCWTSAHGSTMHHVWSPTCLGFSLLPLSSYNL